MSILHPIRIERYLLYLDQVVFITLDDQDAARYLKVVFADGDRLTLPRTMEGELETLLPSSFLRYSNLWINDMYVKYMEMIWDETTKTEKLYTRFMNVKFNVTAAYAGSNKVVPLTRDTNLVTANHMVESGTTQEIQELIEDRKVISMKALFTTEPEVRDEIVSVATPIVQQTAQSIVAQEITKQVTPIIKGRVDEALTEEIQDMGVYFNNLLKG